MKKVIALVLALVMVFALCACGSSDSASSTKAASSDEKVVKIGLPAVRMPPAARRKFSVSSMPTLSILLLILTARLTI